MGHGGVNTDVSEASGAVPLRSAVGPAIQLAMPNPRQPVGAGLTKVASHCIVQQAREDGARRALRSNTGKALETGGPFRGIIRRPSHPALGSARARGHGVDPPLTGTQGRSNPQPNFSNKCGWQPAKPQILTGKRGKHVRHSVSGLRDPRRPQNSPSWPPLLDPTARRRPH